MKTNNLFYLLFLLLAIFTTGCKKHNYEVTIFYASDNIANKVLYLTDGKEVVDSIKVTKEPFTFKGYTDSVCIGSIVESNPEAKFPVTSIILQKDQKINVIIGRDITFDDNGGVNSIWNEFNKSYAGIIRNNKEVFQQMVLKHTDAEKLKQFNEENNRNLEAYWKDAVIKNADNVAGAAIFKDYCTDMINPLDFEPLSRQLKYANLFPSIEKDRIHYKNKFRSAEGQPFIDFKGKSIEGKEISFSEFAGKGKYVLAFFWSTNDISCRGGNPMMDSLNKKLGGDKFMVVGVNIKNDEAKFKEAIKHDKIDYTQIYISNEDNSVESAYDIPDVPYLVLFDPEGKIIKRKLMLDNIEQTIKKYIAK